MEPFYLWRSHPYRPGAEIDKPNHGRARVPRTLPARAAANQSHPCRLVETTPPKYAPILHPNPIRAPYPISNPPTTAATRDMLGTRQFVVSRPANPAAIN